MWPPCASRQQPLSLEPSSKVRISSPRGPSARNSAGTCAASKRSPVAGSQSCMSWHRFGVIHANRGRAPARSSPASRVKGTIRRHCAGSPPDAVVVHERIVLLGVAAGPAAGEARARKVLHVGPPVEPGVGELPGDAGARDVAVGAVVGDPERRTPGEREVVRQRRMGDAVHLLGERALAGEAVDVRRRRRSRGSRRTPRSPSRSRRCAQALRRPPWRGAPARPRAGS